MQAGHAEHQYTTQMPCTVCLAKLQDLRYLHMRAVFVPDGLLGMVRSQCQGSVQILNAVPYIGHCIARIVLHDSWLNGRSSIHVALQVPEKLGTQQIRTYPSCLTGRMSG